VISESALVIHCTVPASPPHFRDDVSFEPTRVIHCTVPASPPHFRDDVISESALVIPESRICAANSGMSGTYQNFEACGSA
jgi:hypothetical protein